MRALCTRQGHRRDGWGSRVPELHLDLHALVTKQLHAHPSMVSATPVPPEDGLRTDGQWMQQHANLAGFRSGAAIPLTLLAQGAITTTANAGCIDHTQAAVAFSAPLMSTKLLIRRAAQRAIRLEGKILPREAARFPGQSDFCWSVPLNRSLRGGLLVCSWERWSKLGGTHRIRLQLMAQLQSEVPDPLRHDLPDFLTACRMATPTVWILFLIFISQRCFKGTTMQIQLNNVGGGERRLAANGRRRVHKPRQNA